MRKIDLKSTSARTFLAFSMLFFLVTSCNDDDSPDGVDCSGLTPTYTNDIKAILDTSCAISGCHNSTDLANNFDFSTYPTSKAISQGNRFLGAINHQSGFMAMPQGSPKLSNENIQLLTCWVENGSPE